MARKSITKAVRQKVFDKYNGHCAYCGCELTMETMQVDHAYSVFWSEYWDKTQADNSLSNLMPACRQCNFYKSDLDIEHFRKYMSTLMERVRKPFIYRLAEKYGMVEEKQWDGKFYFERIKQYQDEHKKD